MEILNQISETLQKGMAPKVKELVSAALEEKISAKDILENGLLAGMAIIGEKFKENQIFIPEVLVAARAMNAGVEVLKPLLAESGVESKGTVVVGTVKGDLHDIGKNLVKLMLEGRGLNVIDLGVDVSPEKFVEEAISNKAQVICCSALLTTTMTEMANVVKLANEKGVRDKVKILIGGAPITDKFCKEIGADGYEVDAASAADTALKYCAG
ncbi:MAG: corrinoid protein [Oscillospiraceae bacterium]|nr:corrinoid protein [Oscillospiraceae bacterium]